MADQAATTTIAPFRFFDLPGELRNRIYTELAVPSGVLPQELHLGNVFECEKLASGCCCGECTLNNVSHHSCREEAETHMGTTTRHFETQYRRYRCWNVCRANMRLYEELTDVFYSRNKFMFHTSTDLLHFLRRVVSRHAGRLRHVFMVLHGVRRENVHGPFCPPGCACRSDQRQHLLAPPLLTPALPTQDDKHCSALADFLKALDLLARCPNLRIFTPRFLFRIERGIIMDRFAWLSVTNPQEHCSAWRALYTPTTSGDAEWLFRPLEYSEMTHYNLSAWLDLPTPRERLEKVVSLLRPSRLQLTDLAYTYDEHLRNIHHLHDRRFDHDMRQELAYCTNQLFWQGIIVWKFWAWRQQKDVSMGRVEELLSIMYRFEP